MQFDDFVAARLPALLRYATVLAGDPHHGEDVLPEVLLRAQGRWQRIAALDVSEAYIRRMIINELVSLRRRIEWRLRRRRVHGVDAEVRGGTGWLEPDQPALYLPLRDGVWARFAVEVTAPPDGSASPAAAVTGEELVRTAEEFDFGPWPQMSWAGGR